MATAKKIDPKNLVYLVYASNTCYTSVIDAAPEGVMVDIESGTWRFENEGVTRVHLKKHAYKIGSDARYCEWGAHWGIIGVYDRTNISHLNAMVYASKKATVEPPGPFDD